jgi:hypothetical protein
VTQLVQPQLARGAHAFVIGIGEYPRLDGGPQPRFAHFEAMGQPSSPPVSARGFAEWLLSPTGYRNPACPLASLDLLERVRCGKYFVSTNGAQFKHPDREAIARVIEHGGPSPTLYFNYDTTLNAVRGTPTLTEEFDCDTVYVDAEGGLTVAL